jgi:surfactin synthase thioesterase subunit
LSKLDDIFITTPIYAIMGTGEDDSAYIHNWAKYTSGNFGYELMEGDHFFVFNNGQKIAEVIEKLADGYKQRVDELSVT